MAQLAGYCTSYIRIQAPAISRSSFKIYRQINRYRTSSIGTYSAQSDTRHLVSINGVANNINTMDSSVAWINELVEQTAISLTIKPTNNISTHNRFNGIKRQSWRLTQQILTSSPPLTLRLPLLSQSKTWLVPALARVSRAR